MKFDLNFQRVIIAIALKIPLSWYKGGGGGIETPPPRVFVLWQYCETILFSVESLLSSLKDTNNGCHLFVGLDMKHNTQISTLYDFSHNIYFYC